MVHNENVVRAAVRYRFEHKEIIAYYNRIVPKHADKVSSIVLRPQSEAFAGEGSVVDA